MPIANTIQASPVTVDRPWRSRSPCTKQPGIELVMSVLQFNVRTGEVLSNPTRPSVRQLLQVQRPPARCFEHGVAALRSETMSTKSVTLVIADAILFTPRE